jgi:CubicO group peptidase (beta-lactamase class C family)
MNKLRFSSVFLVSFLFFVNYPGYSQISSTEIDRLVEESMEKFNVAGVAVGIVKDGRIIHSKGYGVKSIETGEKVNQHTNFAIASNTKAFTTAALSILVDEGKISWKDKVIRYIPEFKMYNAYVTENFNIQDLLTHRSGLGLGAGDLMFFPDGADFTIKDILSCFQYFEPQSAFRTKYDYDNLLYFVAGEVIARASGMSWEEFVKTRIMEPLDMDNSFTSLKQITDRSNVATPHSTETGPMKTVSNYVFDPEKMNGAAGAIYSNVDDLCSWMLLHLNRGKYGENLEKRLFSAANYRELWKIHTTLSASPDPRYNSHFAGYGLGWHLTDMKGNMSVSHTGGMPGMLSKTILIPDLNLGVVVLTNTSYGGGGVFTSVTQTIIDSYLGLDDFEWMDKLYERFHSRLSRADSVTAQVWETVRSADDAHINPGDYTGVYQDNWFGKIEVYMVEDQLWFRSYRSPKLKGPMYYYKANAFAIKWEDRDLNADAFAIFSLDEEGKVHSIRMKGISPNIDFSFDFQDLDLRRIENE